MKRYHPWPALLARRVGVMLVAGQARPGQARPGQVKRESVDP